MGGAIGVLDSKGYLRLLKFGIWRCFAAMWNLFEYGTGHKSVPLLGVAWHGAVFACYGLVHFKTHVMHYRWQIMTWAGPQLYIRVYMPLAITLNDRVMAVE